MQIYDQLNNIPLLPGAIITQGTFDGVHSAHRAIIKRIVEIAHQRGAEPVLITYEPHPRHVLYPEQSDLKLLTNLSEKKRLLAPLGIKHLIVLPFTREFAQQSYTDFVRDVIIGSIQAGMLVIGYDHRFGKNREGSFEQLIELSRTFPLELEQIPQQMVDSVAVSSTKIRNALFHGDLETANLYLGYSYVLGGTVVHGNKLGRTIGFPTANIEPDDQHKLLPSDGVYAVRVQVGTHIYSGMCNIGMRPTIGGTKRVIEVHLFDVHIDLYHQEIVIHFEYFLREERTFTGLDALKKQLAADEQMSREKLKHLHPLTQLSE